MLIGIETIVWAVMIIGAAVLILTPNHRLSALMRIVKMAVLVILLLAFLYVIVGDGEFLNIRIYMQ